MGVLSSAADRESYADARLPPLIRWRVDNPSVQTCQASRLALQLLCLWASESMGNHDSNVVDAGRVG
jgi:hypothetical protein